MSEDKKTTCNYDCCYKKNKAYGGGMGGGLYGLGFIAAAVYFIQNSDTFWMGTLGILKAIIWPALVVFKVLGLLNL